jgi:hypothetical protein
LSNHLHFYANTAGLRFTAQNPLCIKILIRLYIHLREEKVN